MSPAPALASAWASVHWLEVSLAIEQLVGEVTSPWAYAYRTVPEANAGWAGPATLSAAAAKVVAEIVARRRGQVRGRAINGPTLF